MVRRELAALLRLAETAAARGQDDSPSLDHMLATVGEPTTLDLLQRLQRRLREGSAGPGLERILESHRDREAGAVTDLEQPLSRGPSALSDAVAAVLPCELDAELLEPVNGSRSLGGQHLDELSVRRLVRAAPHVLCVLLGRVVLSEGGLFRLTVAELQDWRRPWSRAPTRAPAACGTQRQPGATSITRTSKEAGANAADLPIAANPKH